VEPFRLDVPESELTDLRERLRRTRWPEPATAAGWTQGVPLEFLRELCAYWADGYDWRRLEARLNALGQFRTTIDGLGIHFLHVRSPHPGALPLVLSHGWPGSVVEFLDVIGPLTDPPDPADAFHVVCPSLPGYGFSDRPAEPGWTVERIADAWVALMARLGYDRYGAQGGDWGASITTVIGQRDPRHLAGIHLMPPIVAPDPATFDELTPAEQAALDALGAARDGDGYSAVQSTRPQTIGYGLVDSPVGLCAWLVEKLRSWTDEPLDRDRLLDDVMLYWLPATGASAARLYAESFPDVQARFRGANTDVVDVPTGCSVFPAELPRPSRRWAARRYRDIRYWNEPARGGHFAAFEQPQIFVDELRAFFGLVR
jgi:pimeloyl-ACP methyl ester carboxylesterase